jgi:hypothetical protein
VTLLRRVVSFGAAASWLALLAQGAANGAPPKNMDEDKEPSECEKKYEACRDICFDERIKCMGQCCKGKQCSGAQVSNCFRACTGKMDACEKRHNCKSCD